MMMNRYGLIGFWCLLVSGCAFHSPPVISDIAEDRIKVELDRNLLESAESLATRQRQAAEEAQRGCDLYDRGRAVLISSRCIREMESGACDVEEYLFACTP